MAQNYGLVRNVVGNAPLKPIPKPTVPDDYLLVRTVAIALNPTDWTTLDTKVDDGTIVGCDYAGVVEEVGPKVKWKFKKGDRVAGFSHGGNDENPETGAFARYIIVKGDIQMHIPDNVSFEEARAVGSGIATTGYALYKVLGLPYPVVQADAKPVPILIYRGSTVTATIATRFAKLSGRRVITACSPKHFDLVKQRGADDVFDYRAADVGTQIREASNGELTQILDTVALEGTAAICAEAFGPNGGVYCNLLGIDCPRNDVESIFFLGYNLSGEAYIFEGESFPAVPEDHVFAQQWVVKAEDYWADGLFEKGREGKISGVKLVYRIDDTVWPAAWCKSHGLR